MNETIQQYITQLEDTDQAIGQKLTHIIDNHLAFTESKVWHAHPVWFIHGNPIVGFSKQKAGMRLMFWSGADFDEIALAVRGQKFKDASIFYHNVAKINEEDLKRWLQKSETIQWDYKNLIKRKGVLERL